MERTRNTAERSLRLPEFATERYTAIRLLGQGGIASVFQVLDNSTGSPVALKVLHSELAESPVQRHRLRREFEILRALNNPGIARALDFHETADASPFFTLELIEGENLEIRSRDSNLSIREILEVLHHVAQTFGYLHDSGVVFCDLKLSNIMLRNDTRSGATVLIDFGLAHDGGRFYQELPRTGSLVGTSLYMAPEQIRGDSPTPLVDVYAFGVMAYELLAGRTPFESNDTFNITNSHLLAEVPDVRELNPKVPRDVATMIQVCLAKDPIERYQSMWELAERIHAIRVRLAHQPPKKGFLRFLGF